MRAGGGKFKGSGFERDVARKLSRWITDGARDDLVTRTVLSGGQFTISERGVPGDLMSAHPLGFVFFEKIVIECKAWKYIELIDFIAKKGDLYKAAEKVRLQAEKCGKSWFLVVKQNYRPTLLFFPSSLLPIDSITACNWHKLFCSEVVAIPFDDFCKYVPFSTWKTHHEPKKPVLMRREITKRVPLLRRPITARR